MSDTNKSITTPAALALLEKLAFIAFFNGNAIKKDNISFVSIQNEAVSTNMKG